VNDAEEKKKLFDRFPNAIGGDTVILCPWLHGCWYYPYLSGLSS